MKKHNSRTLQTLLIFGVLVGVWLLSSSFLSASPFVTSDSFRALLAFRSPIGNPELTLNKTINNPTPKAGGLVIYTLTYANIHNGSQAFNVRLYDFLPDGLEVLSTNPPADYNANGVLIFNADSVGPGTENVVVTVSARVLDGYESLNNQALVVADGVTPTHTTLETAVTPYVRQVSLTKTGYPVVLQDSLLVYRIKCENTGDVTLEDLSMVDVLPTGVTFQNASPAPASTTYPLVQWSRPSLAVGDVWEVVLTTTSPSTLGVFTNTAFVDAEKMEMVSALRSTRVISEGAILFLGKTGSEASLFVGDEVVYTLQYQNLGNLAADDILLTDTLPADITVTGYNTTPVSTNAQRIVWEFPSIAPSSGGTVVFTATIGGEPGRMLHNVADIDGPGEFDDSHAEFDIYMRFKCLYLPLVMQGYNN